MEKQNPAAKAKAGVTAANLTTQQPLRLAPVAYGTGHGAFGGYGHHGYPGFGGLGWVAPFAAGLAVPYLLGGLSGAPYHGAYPYGYQGAYPGYPGYAPGYAPAYNPAYTSGFYGTAPYRYTYAEAVAPAVEIAAAPAEAQ